MTYRMLGELGRGAMGVVYRALQVDLKREVALKLIDLKMLDNELALKRFHREVKVASELVHPGIARVYDSGELDGRPYYTMEIVPGRDLGALLAAEGPQPLERVAGWMAAAAEALAYVHGRGLTHRDVKPGNLMVTPDDRIVLLDFGLARGAGAMIYTRPGEAAGTPKFMAPEALRGEEPAPPVDVWALALVADLALTGRQWPEAKALDRLIAHVLGGPVPRIEEALPGAPPWLIEAQRGALQRAPADRITAQAYRDLLRDRPAVIRGSGAVSRAPARSTPRAEDSSAPSRADEARAPGPAKPAAHSPGALAAVALGLAFALGAGLLVRGLMHTDPPRPPSPPPVADAQRVKLAPVAAGSRRLAIPLTSPPAGTLFARSAETGAVLARAAARDGENLLERLPPDAPLVIGFESPGGQPLAPTVHLRTPRIEPALRFRCYPTDRAVWVGFVSERPVTPTVEIGRWATRTAEVSYTAPTTSAFSRVFANLRADTEHFVRVKVESGWGGLADYRFTTWSPREGRRHEEMLERLRNSSTSVEEFAQLLQDRPSAGGVAVLCEKLAREKPGLGVRHLAWLARQVQSRCLVDRLLPLLSTRKDDGDRSAILLAAMECGHPDTGRLAARALESMQNETALAQLAEVVVRTVPDPYTKLEAAVARDPTSVALLSWLVSADPTRAHRMMASWFDDPPRERDPRLVWAVRGLGRSGTPADVAWLGRLARRPDRPWLASAAVDELVHICTPEATAQLVGALAEHPRAPALIWGAVRAGAAGAAPHLTATLADANAGPHRPVAALALGALPWPAAAPALRAALTEPDAELAHAAAWALGQLADGEAGPLLANRLKADRTGVVAWALARTNHRAAAEPLIQRLMADRDATAPGVARRTLVALAAARLADDAQAARLIDQARTEAAPVADALRRALSDRVTPPQLAVDVFPFVPFVRVPLPIHAGDVVELAGQGSWALAGAPQLASATVEQRLDEDRRLVLTYWIGFARARLASVPIVQPVEREGTLVLGPVNAGHDTELTAPLAGAHGHARVTLRY